MKNRVLRLKVMYYAPVLIAALRLVVTIVILLLNPQSMSFRFLQVIPLGVLAASCFSYMKLYTDGDPVVSLLVPTIAHVLLILVFKKMLQLVPFIVPFFLDVAFLIVKGLKAAMFPFEIEGEEEEQDTFEDLEVGV